MSRLSNFSSRSAQAVRRSEQGSVLLMVVLAMPVLLLCMAFVIDVAWVWGARQQAQVAADAGALAGAQDLTTTNADATAVNDAQTYASKNDPGATVSASVNDSTDSISVNVAKTVKLPFGGVYKITSSGVNDGASASDSLVANIGENVTTTQTQNINEVSGYWNFCGPDGLDDGVSGGHLEGICEASNYQPHLGAWTMLAGNVDIVENGASSKWNYGSASDAQPVVDLLGTCVEDPDGSTTPNENGYTGYCDDNADGELATSLPTTPGTSYTITFNVVTDAGSPKAMPFELLVTSFNLFNTGSYAGNSGGAIALPLISTKDTKTTTVGTSGSNCNSSGLDTGTYTSGSGKSAKTYPYSPPFDDYTCWYDGTEVQDAGAPVSSYSSTPSSILASSTFTTEATSETEGWINQYGGTVTGNIGSSTNQINALTVYNDPSQSVVGDHYWTETMTFTATARTTDVAFISLINCYADDYSPGGSPSSYVTDSGCTEGPGIADFSVTGYGAAALTN